MKNDARRLNEEADEIIEELKKTRARLSDMARIGHYGGVVTWDALDSIKVGMPFSPASGIVMHRIADNLPGVILIFARMEPGAYLLTHEHDCWERGTVLWGETLVNDGRHHPFESFLFEPGERHRLFSQTGCAMILTYRKEKPA